MIDPRSVIAINYAKDARYKVKLIHKLGRGSAESDWHDHRDTARAEASDRLEALLAEGEGPTVTLIPDDPIRRAHRLEEVEAVLADDGEDAA